MDSLNNQDFLVPYKYYITETVKFLNPNIIDLDAQVIRMINLEREIASVYFLKYNTIVLI